MELQPDQCLEYQALYGYSDGHRLLMAGPGFRGLPAPIRREIERYSDLTGYLPMGLPRPVDYYSVWRPAPCQYAFMRTVEDADASRAGCVLSHVLVLTFQRAIRQPWMPALLDPVAVQQAGAFPTRQIPAPEVLRKIEDAEEAFRHLLLPPAPTPPPYPGAAHLIDRLEVPGDLAIVDDPRWSASALHAAWSSLDRRQRERFSACGLALQPGRRWDLLFVPSHSRGAFCQHTNRLEFRR